MYIRSSPVAVGPVRCDVRVVPSTDFLTMSATRPKPSCNSGVPTPPDSTMGRYQALWSLLVIASRNAGVWTKS